MASAAIIINGEETGIAETSTRRAILFADVCDSTAIYEAIGDAKAHALINRLLALLGRKVKAAGGAVVKTLGDGIVCQFGSADAAYRAACEMQVAAHRVTAPGARKLAIKVGYTYGPVVPKVSDVFGDTVNLCARLVALANPGQVLTTQQTVEAQSPGLRQRCRALYETKVRGRASQVTVCEVLWRTDPDVTELKLTQEGLARASQWVLKLTYGDDSYTVESTAAVKIGRDKSNDVVVPSQHASRLHARLFGRDGNFVIVDQSSNGTFVMIDGNTRELRLRREEAVIGEGGKIGLGTSASTDGDHVLRYRVERRGS
ncbi:MAG TPA: adenylate/guanylate cyclase domain-containing protein [Burkholderiales bacterium]|nr:adenylate/guanylate cyclase domain-containing protein [Burkholderiales bacterium]